MYTLVSAYYILVTASTRETSGFSVNSYGDVPEFLMLARSRLVSLFRVNLTSAMTLRPAGDLFIEMRSILKESNRSVS